MKKMIALVLIVLMLASLAACSGEPKEKVYKVGICQFVQHEALDLATKGFRDALTEKLGDKVEFDEQNAQLEISACSTIVTGFVSNGYDLIMANATPPLSAAITATASTDIPVLGTSVTDYAEGLGYPELDPAKGSGMNFSGTSDGVPAQMYADCLLELVPDAKKVVIIYCNSEPNSVLQADQFVACMDAMNIATEVFTFTDSNDIQAVVTAAIEGADAMYIPTDNTAASNMALVQGVCEAAKMPIICGEAGMCGAGGLATVSIDYYDIGYDCGLMAYEIMVNGADVGAMPIGYSKNPVKAYNKDYADAIGFTMPESYEVIVTE